MEHIKSPVIKSQLMAELEARQWSLLHASQTFVDKEQQKWELEITHRELPDPQEPKTMIIESSLQFYCKFQVQDLVNSAIFDPIKDARLISLLEERTMELRLSPLNLRSKSSKECDSALQKIIPRLKEKLAQSPMAELKCKAAFKMLDTQKSFGSYS